MSIVLASGQRLSRTFGTPTDARKGRLEISVKRSSLPSAGAVLLGTTNQGFIAFGGATVGGSSSALVVNAGGNPIFVSTATIADLLWHDLVLSWDTTQATASNRFSATLDGVALSWSTSNWPAQNTAMGTLFSAVAHTIGALVGYSIDLLSTLARVRYQDGNASSGGALGNNGFVLDFVDSADLGMDDGTGAAGSFAGSNDWTLVGSPTWTGDAPGGSPPPPPPTDPTLPKVGVILWGQSLGANWNGPGLHTMRNPTKCDNIDVNTGTLAAAVPPLPGPDSNGGTNFLPDLLDNLYDTGLFSRVVGGSVCVGGSATSTWAAGGANNGRISSICAQMLSNGVVSAVVISVIGEADAQNSLTWQQIRDNMQSAVDTFKASGLKCRFIVHRESYDIGGSPNGANVRLAQAALVNNKDVFAGPDLDQFLGTNRITNDHLSELGNANVAYLDGVIAAALYRSGTYSLWQL